MAQQKPGVMLYFELRPSLRRLSSRERLALYDAIMDYGEWGVVLDFTGKLAVAWDFVQPKLDRDDDNYARKSQVRRYAVYIRESKKDGVLPLPYEQWLASLPETSQPETSNDTNRYPTTTATATATATSTTTTTAATTDCCYMPAAGKPPRQPQRLIPPTVEEVRAYAAQRGNPPAPVSTAPGRGGSKPPAAAQPLNIQRTAQLRQLREAKSLPYVACTNIDHSLQGVCVHPGAS